MSSRDFRPEDRRPSDDAAWAKAAWTDAFVDIQGEDHPSRASARAPKCCGTTITLYRLRTGGARRLGHAHLARFGNFSRQRFRSVPQSYRRCPEIFRVRNQRAEHRMGFIPPKPTTKAAAPTTVGRCRVQVGIAIDGTLNDPRDRDKGWSVELALPGAPS